MRQKVEFFVAGQPKPQGSKRAIMHPNAKHPSIIESAGQALKDWRGAVSTAAADHGPPMTGALNVLLEFYLLRPKSHYGTGRNAEKLKSASPENHTQKPDIDKLTRAVLDALSNRVYHDDSQVHRLIVLKQWAGRERQPGCRISVAAVEKQREPVEPKTVEESGFPF